MCWWNLVIFLPKSLLDRPSLLEKQKEQDFLRQLLEISFKIISPHCKQWPCLAGADLLQSPHQFNVPQNKMRQRVWDFEVRWNGQRESIKKTRRGRAFIQRTFLIMAYMLVPAWKTRSKQKNYTKIKKIKGMKDKDVGGKGLQERLPSYFPGTRYAEESPDF